MIFGSKETQYPAVYLYIDCFTEFPAQIQFISHCFADVKRQVKKTDVFLPVLLSRCYYYCHEVELRISTAQMLTIKQVQSSDDIYAVRRLLQALTKWVNALEPGSVDSPAFKNVRNELASLPGKFAPPTGRLLLARLSDSAAGCIAYLRIDDTVCELKRMYVDPSFRGQGIGQALVQELLSLAHHNAFERVILASHITMHSAHRVYETNGFRRTLPWDNYSKEYSKKIVFMECDLRINKNKTENLRDE